MKNINEIIATIKNYQENGYKSFAVRGDNVDINVGEKLDCSYDWDYENDCCSEEKLNGTCGIAFGYLYFDGEEEDLETVENAINYCKENYCYKNFEIIAGTDEEYGADEKEIVIKNAICIYNIK